MPTKPNLIGPGGRLFAEPIPGTDEASFRVSNTSSQYYNSPYYLMHKSQVQPIPPARKNAPMHLNLADFVGPQIIQNIANAGKISFHSVGDTGAAKVNRQQTAGQAIANEAKVSDAMAADLAGNASDAPAFFFHLGDVIYNFGEAQYYYDQFYEPFRAYDRPIFAIPGNHDGSVFGQGSSAPQVPTLTAFLDNFCATNEGVSPDAGGLVRSVMTQPAVYFTLDAPFVSVIGLYSNVLEGPGVISSQGGHYPIVDDQLTFLKSELQRIKPDHDAGKRALIIALHHPPLSADAKHAGSDGAEKDIDNACQQAGVWPDLMLSGHAHLYQRFTRRVANKEIPYIVAGSGGFAATQPQTALGNAPITVGDHTLEINPLVDFGYLIISTDAKTLTVSFRAPTGSGVQELDSVTVDIQKGKITSSGSKGGGKAPGGKPPAGKPPKAPKPPKKKPGGKTPHAGKPHAGHKPAAPKAGKRGRK
jgi:hypothetical protein